jgi:hypothetical protein
MKTPFGTFASKLGILAVTATALTLLISACSRYFILPTKDRPILVKLEGGGVRTTKSPREIQEACRRLNEIAGNRVCDIIYYNKEGHEVFHEGKLTITGAVRSEAAGNISPADQTDVGSVIQKLTFTNLDEAADFLGKMK